MQAGKINTKLQKTKSLLSGKVHINPCKSANYQHFNKIAKLTLIYRSQKKKGQSI